MSGAELAPGRPRRGSAMVERGGTAGTAAPGLRGVRRERATQQVRDQLLAAIEAGQYPPGSLIPSERVLCETLGVSRVSVREAIAGLEALGVLSVQHGKGAFVTDTLHRQVSGPFQRYLEAHRDELLDLLMVRGVLDELAAAQAATLGTPETRAEMSRAFEEFREEAQRRPVDFARLTTLDVAFHLAIARASNSALLVSLLSDLHGVLEDSRRLALARSSRQPQLSVLQHESILRAILAGDTAKARREVRRHLEEVRAWVEAAGPEPASASSSA